MNESILMTTSEFQQTGGHNVVINNLSKEKYWSNYKIEGSCNYAFPIVLKTKIIKKRDQFEKILIKNNIEFRRGNAGGGNQLRQPYLKDIISIKNFNKFKNVEQVHFFGYYIGNYPSLTKNKILQITNILNNISF